MKPILLSKHKKGPINPQILLSNPNAITVKSTFENMHGSRQQINYRFLHGHTLQPANMQMLLQGTRLSEGERGSPDAADDTLLSDRRHAKIARH